MSIGIVTLLRKVISKPKKTIPFWLVIVLGLPLPLLSEWLSIGGKSLVEYTYLFMIGYFVFSEDEILNKAEKNRWLLFSIGLVTTILNV